MIADRSIAEVLESRRNRREPGRFYAIDEKRKTVGVLDAYGANVATDPAAMSATFVISTPTPDRSDDVVVPEGMLLDPYRTNPIVYFDHGFDLTLPIGKSEDPDGNLAVKVSPAGVEATCYFAQREYEATRIFELVNDKILRCASVRIDAIKARARPVDPVRGGYRPGLQIDECELLEWSVVGIPDNPEALRKKLDHWQRTDRDRSEPLLKSLQSFAAQPLGMFPGWTPQETVTLNDGATVMPLKPKNDPKPGKTKAKPKAEDDEEVVDEKPADDETPADEVPADEAGDTEEEIMSVEPLGATVLRATHGGLASMVAQLSEAAGPLENPDVKESVAGLLAKLGEAATEIEATFSACYPDRKMADEEEAPDASAEAVKKFLAGGRSQRLRVKGYANLLTGLAGAKSLSAGQRSTLSGIAGGLSKMIGEAEKAQAAAPPEDYSELVAELAELKKRFDGVLPYRRAQ